ncbi:hypothetical protein [Tunturiibacter gelidoferens]|uniref:Uncharacterized protein n=2 Tax=Tunturiibacter gelidiferens TaxID=3069689 RepID=A0AAU7YX87_9BACT|nr:hypothetical protein [Edaphobacter lichenicola]MBB5338723.1 hypothetical protein [Edaphobacter lichenicola]
MSSRPIQTDTLESGRSEAQFLLFKGNRKQLDGAANTIDINMLAPLLVGVVAAILVVVLYAFLLGKLG